MYLPFASRERYYLRAMSTDHANTVVAHDQMWTYGGAERVALHIGAALDAPVYTTYAGETARAAAADLDVDLRAFAQDRYEGLGALRRVEGFKSASLALDWQTAPLDAFEFVVSAHMFTRQYRTLDHQYLLNYCHSPPRWINDLLGHRLSSLPTPARDPAKAYVAAMDLLDARSADRVDAFVANSEVIRDRIRRYYRRDATVIYPPIDTAGIDPRPSEGDYYLMVGRVVESKRPGTVVDAFERAGTPLKVAGTGDNEPLIGESAFARVRSRAGSNVEFLGYVSDDRKADLLADAKAVVYVPIREDFGMVPIEALAAGTPVIAANEGFPAIAIDDGETGAVVEPTVGGVLEGIERIEANAFDPERLAAVAARYGAERFADRIRAAVDRFRADPERYRRGDELLLDADAE